MSAPSLCVFLSPVLAPEAGLECRCPCRPVRLPQAYLQRLAESEEALEKGGTWLPGPDDQERPWSQGSGLGTMKPLEALVGEPGLLS